MYESFEADDIVNISAEIYCKFMNRKQKVHICVSTFTHYNVKPTIANFTKIVSTIAKQWNDPHLIKIDIEMNIVVRYEQRGIYDNKGQY